MSYLCQASAVSSKAENSVKNTNNQSKRKHGA